VSVNGLGAAKLRPELRTEPKTSDTVRLRRELEI
jgi:hypothetical protein